jgi:hypothetical protein
MAIRFYLVPILTNDAGTARYPAYFWSLNNRDGIRVPWSMKDYGLIPAALVAADVTPEQHAQLIEHDDVTAPPIDIDQAISSAALSAVKAALESLRIPAEWVTTDYSYRQILRMVASLFIFAQRHYGLHNEQLIDSTNQLDLRWNQIPLERRNRIIATADSLEYDYSAVESTWLVRRILKHLGDQWGEQEVLFGITTL